MTEIAFFCMNQKGYMVLRDFLADFDSSIVRVVICSRDKGLKKDYYEEIRLLCLQKKICFYERTTYKEPIDKRILSVAIGWRWLIPDVENLIVLHDSLLPKYRGFSPLVNMLVNGEKEIGVTALLASSEYDEGDIILQKSIEITYPIKICEAINLILPLYSSIVIEVYKSFKDNTVNVIPQNDVLATYSLWLNDDDYFINWSEWSAEKIIRFINAVGYPYGGAKTHVNKQVVWINNSIEVSNVVVEDRDRHIGKVLFRQQNDPVVICSDGLIRLEEIVDEEGAPASLGFRSKFH